MASDAKQRLLTAAIKIFARRGYLAATISEISEAADANIAAVNYYFGSKETLFLHVLREAYAIANRRYPLDGGLPPDAPADERLRAFMGSLIRRSFDSGPAGHFTRIMTHLGRRETAPNELFFEEVRKLEGTTLDSILTELLQTRSKTILAQARMNVIGLSVLTAIAPHFRRTMFASEPSSAKLRTFINRQVRFALTGLATLRAEPARQAASR